MSSGQPYFSYTRMISFCASLVDTRMVLSGSSAGEVNCFANSSDPEPVWVNATMVNPRGMPPPMTPSNLATPKLPTVPKNSSSSALNLTSDMVAPH